jgi:hypothetical protein
VVSTSQEPGLSLTPRSQRCSRLDARTAQQLATVMVMLKRPARYLDRENSRHVLLALGIGGHGR